MMAETFVIGDNLHIQFGLLGGIAYKYCFKNEIGKTLADFSAIDIEDLSDAYDRLLDFVIANQEEIVSNNRMLKKYISDHANELMLDNPYAVCFNSYCISFIFQALHIDKTAVFNQIKDRLSGANKVIHLFFEFFDKVEPTEKDRYYYLIRYMPDPISFDAFAKKYGTETDDLFLYLIKASFMEEISIWINRINSEFDSLYSTDLAKSDLTPLQKLYVFDFQRKREGKDQFLSNIKFPTYIRPVNIQDYEKFGIFIYEKDSIDAIENVMFAEVSEADSFSELFAYEIIKIAETDPKIKKCENCGKYFFIGERKASAKYCDRIPKGAKSPCYEIGATKKFARAEKHPAVALYNKAYKHFHYLWQQKGEISMADFDKWKDYASASRDKCRKGEIPLTEFEKFTNLGFKEALKEVDNN